jgi:hypothetical protein
VADEFELSMNHGRSDCLALFVIASPMIPTTAPDRRTTQYAFRTEAIHPSGIDAGTVPIGALAKESRAISTPPQVGP